ncbi:MAG: DNA-protecting protein DprA [FCB group bacterium]|nr:DNA-protecting protein DprA [FCB group bacterium]
MTVFDYDATAVILALASVGKIGPVKIKAILVQIDHPTDILEWDSARFCEIPGISVELADRIKRKLDIDFGRRQIDLAEKKGFSIVTLFDPGYPPSLREIYDPPPFMFVAGKTLPADEKAVAVVGSRLASDYGKSTAESLARALTRHGVTIASGMAMGVDSAAHNGALAAGGRTIAVLGSGIDVIYPRHNKELYRQISENGAVLSEFFPGTDPDPRHFPRRNRIISGLSKAVIVVEAGIKSGALLTADLALSQGKKLFAVPGNLMSKTSLGTNDLIKSGARLLTSPEDIFSVLPEIKIDYIAPERIKPEDLTEGENLIFERLSGVPMQMDSVVRECKLSASEATAYLLSLELRGLIKQLSGKRFIAT